MVFCLRVLVFLVGLQVHLPIITAHVLALYSVLVQNTRPVSLFDRIVTPSLVHLQIVTDSLSSYLLNYINPISS